MNQEIYNAEAAVIGGLMLFPDECEVALEELAPTDFQNTHAMEIFGLCLDKRGRSEPVDTAILISELTNKETKAYALLCSQSFLSTANYDGYLDTVKRESGRKRLTEALQTMLIQGVDYNMTLAELERLVEREKRPDKKGDRDYLVEYIEKLYEPINPKDRILLGFSKLDRVTGGLRKESLSYLGAYPSTGKTSLAININIHNPEKRRMFFSLEMSKEQILDRWVAAEMQIYYDRIDEKRLSEAEQTKIMQRINQIYEQNNLLILDDVYSLEAMAGRISRYKPDLVVIDFLQNIRTSGRFPTRKNQIDYISAELKRIARVNKCAIITLSQLTRPDGERKSKKPTMTSLKESGNLEADGDYIMLMYRPYVLDKGGEYPPEQTEILLDKNKYGKCGVVEMRFDGQYQRFTEVETRYD